MMLNPYLNFDGDCAEAIAEIFSEVIVAPDFSPEALAILQKKKNLRLLKILKSSLSANAFDLRTVGADSFLLQERDLKIVTRADLKIVTKRQPTELELSAMLMPAVSPNKFATFTFSRTRSVVCHCCLREKWMRLFFSMLYWP